MSPLTDKQQRVYDFILSHRQKHQTLPSKQEIRYGLDYKNYNSITAVMGALKAKGYIKDSFNNVGYVTTQDDRPQESRPTAQEMDQSNKEARPQTA